MFGRVAWGDTADVVGQVFDDSAEDFAYEIQQMQIHSSHTDVNVFLSTDAFPADGSTPTTAGTRALLISTKNNTIRTLGSTRSQIILAGQSTNRVQIKET